jgi:hypothetical protein
MKNKIKPHKNTISDDKNHPRKKIEIITYSNSDEKNLYESVQELRELIRLLLTTDLQNDLNSTLPFRLLQNIRKLKQAMEFRNEYKLMTLTQIKTPHYVYNPIAKLKFQVKSGVSFYNRYYECFEIYKKRISESIQNVKLVNIEYQALLRKCITCIDEIQNGIITILDELHKSYKQNIQTDFTELDKNSKIFIQELITMYPQFKHALKDILLTGGKPPVPFSSIVVLESRSAITKLYSSKDRYTNLLLMAIQTGNLNTVVGFIGLGADIHFADELPLIYAIVYEHFSIADLFFQRGANIEICKNHLIHILCRANSIRGMQYALKHGLNALVDGADFLIEAMKQNNYIMARCLIAQGVDTGHENSSPLAWACENKNYEAIDFLREYSADFNLNGGLILQNACKKSDLDLIQFLISKGALYREFEEELLKVLCANERDDIIPLQYFIVELGLNILPYQSILTQEALLSKNTKILNYLNTYFNRNDKNIN